MTENGERARRGRESLQTAQQVRPPVKERKEGSQGGITIGEYSSQLWGQESSVSQEGVSLPYSVTPGGSLWKHTDFRSQ